MDPILSGIISTSAAGLVNFIAVKLFNYSMGSTRNFLWQKQEILSFNGKHKTYDFNELKKRIRIVVVDDEEDSFPVKLFQTEGYAIDKWEKVLDYGKLESGFYDIIVLDIQGVAMHISEDDGLGVLESLKSNNPAQIIIAFSQHSYDLSKSRFWELADEKIAKPSDFLKMKKIIDNLIVTKYKPDRYINTLRGVLENKEFKPAERKSIDKLITNTINSGMKPDLEKILSGTNASLELIKQVISISNTIFKFFQ
ncbi:response regulator [Mangrovibacterium lignilyticum]|uniref:response regulator n=1 Tax=Mangrovibacterium lignilyticum TaxID=2668052 RepID=UPI0013CFEEB2|nr:response regulator [Mangrovibacterium lignilyticum]